MPAVSRVDAWLRASSARDTHPLLADALIDTRGHCAPNRTATAWKRFLARFSSDVSSNTSATS